MSGTFVPRGGTLPPDLVMTAHPERLSARLDPRLSAGTLERLRSTERLRPELAEMLVAPTPAGGRPDDLPEAPAEADVARAILNHPPEVLARLAGAAWHGRTLKLLISGKAVTGLVQKIGQHAFEFGLRNADLAVAPPMSSTGPDDLAKAVEADGLRCLGYALLRLPRDIRISVLIRLPPGSIAERVGDEPAAAASAAGIMARVLVHLDDSGSGPEQPNVS